MNTNNVTSLINKVENFILDVEGRITLETSLISGVYSDLEFQKRADSIEKSIYNENIAALICFASQAVKTKDEVVLRKSKHYLKIWTENSGFSVAETQKLLDGLQIVEVEPAIQEVETSAEKSHDTFQTETAQPVRAALERAYEHAETFLSDGDIPKLEKKMYPEIKLAKQILNKAKINLRDVMVDDVHKFLDRAEAYADDCNPVMMNRVFYLCIGLAGIIGIRDQVKEKRILGIKIRAQRAAAKNNIPAPALASVAIPAVGVTKTQKVVGINNPAFEMVAVA